MAFLWHMSSFFILGIETKKNKNSKGECTVITLSEFLMQCRCYAVEVKMLRFELLYTQKKKNRLEIEDLSLYIN